MILSNSFEVPASIDETWRALLDVERVAPCMPGASLDAVDGDDFEGRMRVKVGAIQLAYKLKGRFVERDEANRRVVIAGSGSENRGAGTVKATVTMRLSPAPDGTTVADLATDLDVTGKPAQFGRGVLEDVGTKIVARFARNLADAMKGAEQESVPAGAVSAAGQGGAESDTASPTTVGAPSEPRAVPTAPRAAQESEPLDLLAMIGPPKGLIVGVSTGLIALAGAVILLRCLRRKD